MHAPSFFLSKLTRVRDLPRYAMELPSYLRGVASATTVWGDAMLVPFPEFRSIQQKGYIEGGEEAVYEYFNKTLTDKDIFFDIGANAGFYALLANHKGARVHAFEPFPATFALLQKNARGGMQAHALAVSDTDGPLYMEKAARSGLNHLSEQGTVAVQSISLDRFPIVPTIMKVDVEGNEMRVFKGAEQMLRTHMPRIVVEGSPEATAFLTGLGYTATLLGNEHSGNYLFEKR